MTNSNNQSPNKKRWLLPVVILLITAAIAYYIVTSREPPERQARPTKPTTVSVVTLSPQDYTVHIVSNGTAQARTETTLVAQVTGEVTRLADNFHAGSYFNKGDVLLQIDERDYQTAVTIAAAELSQAQLSLAEEQARSDQAQKDYARLGLAEQPSKLALRKPQLEGAKANVAAAKARLQQAKLNLSRCKITAPYAGRVLLQSANLGQFINSGTSLGTIYATDSVEIRLPVGQSQMGWLDLPETYSDQPNPPLTQPPVTITSTSGPNAWEWQGKIVRTEGAIDASSRQSFLVAQVEDPYASSDSGRPPLKVGQFVKASIAGHTISNALLLPRAALTAEGLFFEVDPDNRLKGHKAAVVWRDTDHFILANTVTQPITIVTSSLPFALDGITVNPITEK